MSIFDLRRLCVDGFPLTTTRTVLMSCFEEVVDRLNREGVVGELWVNGSFLTEKIDPADVDVVLRLQGILYEPPTPDQEAAILWFASDLKASHFCDSYVFAQWPVDHPQHLDGEASYEYWVKWWGHSRSGDEKGVAVIVLRGESL